MLTASLDGTIVTLSFADPAIAAALGAVPGARKYGKVWLVPAGPGNLRALEPVLVRYQATLDADLTEQLARAGRVHPKPLPSVLAAASGAHESDLVIEGIRGIPRPYQLAGVSYISHVKRALLADEQGLGKTITALIAARSTGAFPLVVVCPATLRYMWAATAAEWLPGITVQTLTSGKPVAFTGEVIVLSYDVLHKHGGALDAYAPRMVVFDESHFIKSPKSRRGEAALALARGAPYVVCLTGTPVLNRPLDLVHPLRVLGQLDALGGWWRFTRNYCAAYDTPFGTQYGEPKPEALAELHTKLRQTCYIRRLKRDVAKELPPKQRSVVVLDLDNRPAYNRAVKDFKPTGAPGEHLVQLGTLTRLAGEGKVAAAVDWISTFLASGDKLVVFARHVAVQQALLEKLSAEGEREGYRVVHVLGSDDAGARTEAVAQFQADPDTRLFIGALGSSATNSPAGVGLTLTAASSVAFVEFGWNAALHDQAEDRVHRIGQDAESVNAYYLVARGTVDESTVRLIESKRAVGGAVTDGDIETYSAMSSLDFTGELIAAMLAA